MCCLPKKPKWIRNLRKGFDRIVDSIETLKNKRNGKLWKKLEKSDPVELRREIREKLERMNGIQLRIVLETVVLVGRAMEDLNFEDQTGISIGMSPPTLIIPLQSPSPASPTQPSTGEPNPKSFFELGLSNITKEHEEAQEKLRKQLRENSWTSDYQNSSSLTYNPDHDLEEKFVNKSFQLEMPDYSNDFKFEEQEHEREMESSRRAHVEKELQETLALAEKQKKADMDFQEKMRKIRDSGESQARKAKEERDEYKEETQNLRQKRMAEWEATTAAFIECIRLKHHLKNQEDSWTGWLNMLRNQILLAKHKWSQVEHLFGYEAYQRLGLMEKEDYMTQLLEVHGTVSTAHEAIYDAFSDVKTLSEQFPDRIFIKILEKQLVQVSNKLCDILKEIDLFMINPINVNPIRRSFNELSQSDIPSTWQLKNESLEANWEDYYNIEQPTVYQKVSSVKIQEL